MDAKPTRVVNDGVNPRCQKCKTAACASCPSKLLKDVPEVKNYSQTKRAVLKLMGDKARVWSGLPQQEPPVMIGFEQNPGRLVLGFGDTFQDALEKAIIAHRS